MAPHLSVLIASDVQSTATKIRTALLRQGLDCPHANVVSLEIAVRVAVEHAADLVFVVTSTDRARAAAALEQVRAISNAKLVAVGAAPSPKDILDAIHAGADDYLDASGDLDVDLDSLLQRVRSARSAPTSLGHTMTIASAFGGSGASTVAVNLAAALAQRQGRCGLLDLHLPIGDLTLLLNLKPRHSLGDLCRNATGLDQATFGQALLRHESGVELLASMDTQGADDPVSPEALAKVVQTARGALSHIVVDLGEVIDERQLRIAQISDLIVIILRLDVVALLRTKRSLEFLAKSGIDEARILLVANRRGQAGELSMKMAENAIGRKIDCHLPDDAKTVNTSINVGNPAVLEAPTAKVSKAIQQLCDQIASRFDDARPAVEPEQPEKAQGVVNRISQFVVNRQVRVVESEVEAPHNA